MRVERAADGARVVHVETADSSAAGCPERGTVSRAVKGNQPSTYPSSAEGGDAVDGRMLVQKCADADRVGRFSDYPFDTVMNDKVEPALSVVEHLR